MDLLNRHGRRWTNRNQPTRYIPIISCGRCGLYHKKYRCHAYGKTCFLCKKQNHYSRVCFWRQHHSTESIRRPRKHHGHKQEECHIQRKIEPRRIPKKSEQSTSNINSVQVINNIENVTHRTRKQKKEQRDNRRREDYNEQQNLQSALPFSNIGNSTFKLCFDKTAHLKQEISSLKENIRFINQSEVSEILLMIDDLENTKNKNKELLETVENLQKEVNEKKYPEGKKSNEDRIRYEIAVKEAEYLKEKNDQLEKNLSEIQRSIEEDLPKQVEAAMNKLMKQRDLYCTCRGPQNQLNSLPSSNNVQQHQGNPRKQRYNSYGPYQPGFEQMNTNAVHHNANAAFSTFPYYGP